MRLVIRNGRVVDPANGIDGAQDVYIAEGRIASLGMPPEGFAADREIDARGRVVCPGLVDLCARLREPGLEHKATIASETAAAASAGITTLCCPPDTDPVIDTPAVVQLVRQRAEHAARARVAIVGGLTQGLRGEAISEMGALRDAGCVGVASVHPIANSQFMRRAMEYAATYDLTVFLTPIDPWLHNGGCVHEGAVATRLGLQGIPAAAETAAVARDLALVMETGVRAHFCRLSTADAVRMVARARFDGLPVSADVAAYHLHLTEEDLGFFDTQCHVLPPLRTARDRDGLREGVARGEVQAVCSDHQPHEPDAKQAPFCATEPGVSGVETLLPLALELVHGEALTLPDALARLTRGPAQILRIDAGTLSPGRAADVCIFDPETLWRLEAEDMASQGRNSPFLGRELRGRVTHTLLEGRVVFASEPQ
ncbi:MAG: dihydroorotase [Gammaproteobacteria bacterium]|nr:dihydroorotase [Gammaproteobacteria bacterium]NIR28337.1 dihydroorotase [Gammaproteobacteria bacterium]NIR96751.1 dihydroorotase [Gammaproteobacteria bacterium]NIT62453.1 dihydroorotase [Gammaproteobacteria bacterium]NIV19386.1 dihydroorotase [Gammaproteobacteria bacterium]